jgi:hypothetical protein
LFLEADRGRNPGLRACARQQPLLLAVSQATRYCCSSGIGNRQTETWLHQLQCEGCYTRQDLCDLCQARCS